MTRLRVCLLGFGEVGQALHGNLRSRTGSLTAWDLEFEDATSAPSRAAQRVEPLAAADARSAVAGADLVISAVTAAQIGAAARSVVAHLKPAAFFFDLNSTSPAAKQDAANVIDSAGGRFVEAAIMSPITPRGAASPILIGGAHAEAFLPLAGELGFSDVRLFSGKLGAASAAKMCRSVVVKGLEALLLESLLTARVHGVEQTVLESLHSLIPVENWQGLSRYMISRALTHGRRRAEEMREASRTVAEAGFTPRMSGACAEWEDWASQHPGAASREDLAALLDSLLATQAIPATRAAS